tara:strand:- start:5008 stop:7434 length:2427 start_codon:yes stop_codon:yes gene_type:complete
MAEAVSQDYFPKQNVSDEYKNSAEYGLKVAKAIEAEWFEDGGLNSKYQRGKDNFHKLRSYARGEQSIQKYKDELSINGDLSYLNLDWKPVPIIPKFVDIVVNGMSQRVYDIRAYSQDPFGVEKRTKYMEDVLEDMKSIPFTQMAAQEGIDVRTSEFETEELPANEEELSLHMQLNYKQGIEIAEEEAINCMLDGNNYDLVRKRYLYDLTVLGIGAVKTNYSKSTGITVDYVDPAKIVYSYTESPYFEDIYYIGEVKTIPVNELIKQFPDLTAAELEEIQKTKPYNELAYNQRYVSQGKYDSNKIQVLYFNYKTYNNEVYKMKNTRTGGVKAILKTDQFNPPAELQGDFTKLEKAVEVLYEGAVILGTNKLLHWGLAKNMMRPKSDYTKVKMNYAIVAPRMYNGKIESLVSRTTGFADMIQLTHLKLQQVMSRMIPDGIYLDADGLAEIDLGNGTNYNPQEALNMFFQTGSVIGRSMTADGDMNPGRVPIQEIASGNGGAKMQSLIQTYNYYMQMIRDATGLNEARDGSMPDKNALVGIQKIAAANSNTATRHILDAGLFLTAEIAECLSLRISDVLEYSPTKEAFVQKIGAFNVGVLQELKDLHLHDFGIFIELQPDEEEKQLLENNIQMALQQQSINLEDAIDVREVRNLKLANQLLKVRRKKKQELDQKIAQQNMQQQAQLNQQSAAAAAQAEVQKQQMLAQTEMQLEAQRSEFKKQEMMSEADLKKQLMQLEHFYNMQLKEKETKSLSDRESAREDRKDNRTKMQASQQSKLINQRTGDGQPVDFESANDSMGGGFDVGQFEPSV